MFSNEVLSMGLEPRVLQAHQSGNSNLGGAVKLDSSCATHGPCEIGDRGPGGGIVFYVSDVPFTAPGTECQSNCLYLEYATTGWLAQKQNPPQRDCYSWEIIQRPFTGVWEDPYCVLLKGNNFNSKTQANIGSGFANTTKLLATAGIKSGASVTRNYRGGGKSDWYIPSIDELVALNSTIKKWMEMQDGGHVFEIDPGVSDWGFSDEMWSSTSSKKGYFYTDSAWTDVGTQPGISRNQIRPIRAFGIPNPESTSKKIGNQASSSSDGCAPASVPFVSVKKPWKLDNKKCVNVSYGNFAKYEYSVAVLFKQGRYGNVDELLDKYLAAFQARVNKKVGWRIWSSFLDNKSYSKCPSLREALGYYYCEMQMSRVDEVNQLRQNATVKIESFLPGQFSLGRSISITVEVSKDLWGE